MLKTIVISNEHLSGTNYLLTLERRIDFLPGQVIGVTLGEIAPRLYSIASGTQDDFLRILYSLKPDGVLTPLLASLKKGDELSHTKARGTFLNTKKKSVWIATGTGIAPFISMTRSDLALDQYVETLLHGTREAFHFESDLFIKLLGPKYKRYVSRDPKASPELMQGRVTDNLKALNTLDKQAEYYLCGKAEMVVEVRDLLIEKGIEFSKIKSEIYF